MNHKERMLANLPYKSWLDGLSEERMANKTKVFKYNNLPPDQPEEREKLLREILGGTKEGYLCIESPFFCDYGYNISVGTNFFANYNFVVLDVCVARMSCSARPGTRFTRRRETPDMSTVSISRSVTMSGSAATSVSCRV